MGDTQRLHWPHTTGGSSGRLSCTLLFSLPFNSTHSAVFPLLAFSLSPFQLPRTLPAQDPLEWFTSFRNASFLSESEKGNISHDELLRVLLIKVSAAMGVDVVGRIAADECC